MVYYIAFILFQFEVLWSRRWQNVWNSWWGNKWTNFCCCLIMYWFLQLDSKRTTYINPVLVYCLKEWSINQPTKQPPSLSQSVNQAICSDEGLMLKTSALESLKLNGGQITYCRFMNSVDETKQSVSQSASQSAGQPDSISNHPSNNNYK